MIIAVDGPAASGKGTLSRRLAEAYNLAYLDTGLIYRAVGLKVLEAGKKLTDEDAIIAAARSITNADLTNKRLREDHVSTAASEVGRCAKAREVLLDFQRDFAHNPPQGKQGAILDGRDIGTVVCPDAQFKLFVTADLDVRAQRRHKELCERGFESTYEQVLKDLESRDKRDSSRKAAPLLPAKDVYFLDTSHMNSEETYKKAIEYIETNKKKC